MPIPFQGEPIKSFGEGVQTGNSMLQQLLARKQMQQAQQTHAENLAFRQAQEQRLLAQAPFQQRFLQQQADKMEMENNPAVYAQHYKDLREHLIKNGWSPEESSQVVIKNMGGQPGFETPQQKRAGDLESDIALANVNAQNKQKYPPSATEARANGILANQAYANKLKETYGEDDPRFINAQKIVDSQLAALDSQTGKRNLAPGDIEEQKLDAKERQALKHDLPKIKNYMTDVTEALGILESDPKTMKTWFGKPAALNPQTAEAIRQSQIDDERKGRLDDIIGNLVSAKQSDFSSRLAVAALQYAKTIKVNYDDPYYVTLGKLKHILEKLDTTYEDSLSIQESLGPSHKQKPKNGEEQKNTTKDYSTYTDEELQSIAGGYHP